jgi:hypothetical protein
MYAQIVKHSGGVENWKINEDGHTKTKYPNSGSALGFFKEIEAYLKEISLLEIERQKDFEHQILEICNKVKNGYESSWKARIINQIKNIFSLIFNVKIIDEGKEIEKIETNIKEFFHKFFPKDNITTPAEQKISSTALIIQKPRIPRNIQNNQPYVIKYIQNNQPHVSEYRHLPSLKITHFPKIEQHKSFRSKIIPTINHFAYVPNDILNIIFSDLSFPDDYLTLRFVCKKFNTVIKTNFLTEINIEKHRNRFLLNTNNKIKNFFSFSTELTISEFVDKFTTVFPLNPEFEKLITCKHCSYKEILKTFLANGNSDLTKKISLEQATRLLGYFEPCPTVEHLIYKIASLISSLFFIGEIDSEDLNKELKNHRVDVNTLFLRCSPKKGIFILSYISAREEKQKEATQNKPSKKLNHCIITHDKKKDNFTVTFKEKEFNAPTLQQLIEDIRDQQKPEHYTSSLSLHPSLFNQVTSYLDLGMEIENLRELTLKNYSK